MIGDDLPSFAALVAKVEDAGPGAMKVLRPVGLRPSTYAKMLADWRARMNRDPALRAAFERALAAARRGELPAPTAPSPPGQPASVPVQQASFQIAEAAAPMQPLAPARHKLAATSLALDVPRGDALPFQKTEPEAPAIALTLEQHASLSAEIAARPELAMTIIARYGLTPDAKRALDERYRAAIAESASVWAAWDRAYRAYEGRKD